MKHTLLQSNADNTSNSKCEENNIKSLHKEEDLKVIRTRPQRIRIYHYNPNYQKEMLGLAKRPVKEKPWRRKRCGPFSISQLPSNIIFQLKKEGRLQI
ncbi:MAG TPA: hypothetical protein VIP70_13265 [Nitrososphaeraceae archaeon]